MEEKRFCTINEAGRLGWTPRVWQMRVMRARGELPGYFSGNRYIVDLVRLREMLDAGRVTAI